MENSKKCSKCFEYKDLNSFYNSKVGRHKKQSQCKQCRIIIMRAYRKTSPGITRKHDKKKYLKRKDYYISKQNERYQNNKEYIKQQKKEYNIKNRERISQKQKEHYIKNKPKYQESSKRFRERHKDRLKNKRYLQTYGISLNDLNAMKELQKNQCAICYKETSKLVLDHCHQTKKIRELLCSNCNQGIGLFYENINFLTSAINYVRKHN